MDNPQAKAYNASLIKSGAFSVSGLPRRLDLSEIECNISDSLLSFLSMYSSYDGNFVERLDISKNAFSTNVVDTLLNSIECKRNSSRMGCGLHLVNVSGNMYERIREIFVRKDHIVSFDFSNNPINEIVLSGLDRTDVESECK